MSTTLGHAPGAAVLLDDTAEQQKRSGFTGYLLMLPGWLWLTLFFLVPLVTLVASSLYDPSGSLIDGYAMTWQVQNYLDAIAEYWDIIVRSLGYALAASVACVLLGFPLAYAIAFKAGRWKNLMLVAVIAPFFTSFLVRTLSWQLLLGDQGPLLTGLRSVGLAGDGTTLLATPLAVITGLTYNFLPFMVLPLYASLEKIDHRLIEAASDLYASPFQGFAKVTLPLALPGLVAGTLLTFIPAAGDFINAELLGDPNTTMIGSVIQRRFGDGDLTTGASLSVLLMLLITALVVVYIRRAGTEDLV